MRLPNDLAERVDAEAAASDMSRNEFLVRRLKASFRLADGNRKTAVSGRKVEDELPALPDEEAS